MPQSFVNQALARCSVKGSKYWFNCNPEGPNHWFKVEWIDKKKEKNEDQLKRQDLQHYKCLYHAGDLGDHAGAGHPCGVRILFRGIGDPEGRPVLMAPWIYPGGLQEGDAG